MASNPPHPDAPILLVDDEIAALEAAETALLTQGFDHVLCCEDSRQALGLLRAQGAEVVLLDLVMPHVTGEDLLRQIVDGYPGLPVIVLTGFGQPDRVVECMRAGAFDYLVKPVDADRLCTTVRRALDWHALSRENARMRSRLLSDAIRQPDAFARFDTSDPAVLRVFRYVEAIAPGDMSVLITGETGTGKELLAGALHRASGRAGKHVVVNVSGLDDTMFADTLFGHRRGGFTGATETRDGLVRRAAGGTLQLDEIGDLSGASQVKLLRLLQEREYYPVGSDDVHTSSARVVATTGVDLAGRVASGAFRNDLFHRLRGHSVRMPPLRERLETDLAGLVDRFLTESAERLRKRKPRPPPELLPLLRSYPFPGNVRELEAMIEDAVSRHERGVLSLSSLREHITGRAGGQYPAAPAIIGEVTGLRFPPTLPSLAETTRALIREALARADGNQSLAAQMLGISPQALSQRLRRAAHAGNPIKRSGSADSD